MARQDKARHKSGHRGGRVSEQTSKKNPGGEVQKRTAKKKMKRATERQGSRKRDSECST